MPVTLIYRAPSTGPICRFIASQAPDPEDVLVVHERDAQSGGRRHISGGVVRWGSIWSGTADVQINSATAIRLARDKSLSRQRLVGLCPDTWYLRRDVHVWPCVVRPRRHHAGSGFYVCDDSVALRRATTRCGKGYYVSPLVRRTHEYRIFVLQGRIVGVSERFMRPATAPDPQRVAWNLHAGGGTRTVKRKQWPIRAALVAIQATERLGLDFGAVDVAVTEQGTVVVWEVNVSPGIKKRQIASNLAQAFLWAELEGPAAPVAQGAKRWADVIHPALRQEVGR